MQVKSRWSQKDVGYLTNQWNKKSCIDIAKKLGRKEQSCYDKARQLGLVKQEESKPRQLTFFKSKEVKTRTQVNRNNIKSPRWTISQVKFLKENMGKMSDQEIGEKIGRSIHAVCCKRQSLSKVKSLRPVPDNTKEAVKKEASNKRYKAWTKKEEQIVKEEFNSTSIKQLAKQLGRTENAIKTRAYTLGLIISEENRPRTKWTQEEIDYIKKNVKNKTYEEIGEYLGRSSAAIASKASSLKISKSPLRQSRRAWSLKDSLLIALTTLNFGLVYYLITLLSK